MADAPKDASSGSSQSPSGGGFIRRIWAVLRRPSASLSLLTLVGGGFVAGIIFWGGFNTAMEATNTLEFCTGCHEMRDTVYQEYKGTIHASNRTGVRAVCSDCHVPRDWMHKVVRKVKASREVFGKITGIIDTPEKFEAHRAELAKRVWASMQETNSRECRNCHSFDGMNPKKQSEAASQVHAAAKAGGNTCIECHKGIAHKLPAG